MSSSGPLSCALREKRRSLKVSKTPAEIREQWPLHWMVWEGRDKELERKLGESESNCEQLDPRGRTPLHLAVTLGKVQCADTLLRHGANCLALNRHKWTVLQESVATGNPELVGLVLRHRDQQQAKVQSHEIPEMLERLQSTPDYYIEMKWEVSSWVPFISRLCPSDTYKIWKKGTMVRVDTTLVGFQNLTWQRGNLSFIFKATANGAIISEINHDRGTVSEQHLKIIEHDPVQTLIFQEVGVLQRLNAPIVSTHVNTDGVSFQRQKSGFWGFRSDKVESINGYSSKVFSAAGLDIVSQTRVEHLPELEKSKHKAANPLQNFLGPAEDHMSSNQAITSSVSTNNQTPFTEGGATSILSMEEYFTSPENKDYDALGRPVEVAQKVQKLKATVWLAEDFPLSLQEQIMPIIDLMALNSSHFAQLKDFISLQMPSGFPVKFEIPLFHVMTARVTFGNINGHTEPAAHVSLHMEQRRAELPAVTTPTTQRELGPGITHRHSQFNSHTQQEQEQERNLQDEEIESGNENLPSRSSLPSSLEVCTISNECFVVPISYHRLSEGRHTLANEEEELLQLAIQQSLMQQQQQGGGGGEGERDIDSGGTLGSGGGEERLDTLTGREEITLAEALRDSAILAAGNSTGTPHPRPPPLTSSHPHHHHQPPGAGTTADSAPLDPDLELALALSRQQAEEENRRRQMAAEDEELERVLRLSLEDK